MYKEHKILPTSTQKDKISHSLLQGIREIKITKSMLLKLGRNKRKAVGKLRAMCWNRPSHLLIQGSILFLHTL